MGTDTAPRECKWTRVSEPGEDDGLTWWECSTHDKTEMGGEEDEPDFPCEGWVDENSAARRATEEVTLDLKIENYYEGDKVITRPTITVPLPPDEDTDPDGYDEWLNGDGSIFEATGTGRTEGDSAYFVEVVGSTRPDVIPVGTEYEFGT